MPKHDTIRRVAHSAEKMFNIVADVERYPEFLPLCEGLTVIDRFEKEDCLVLHADMSVGYMRFQETFRSQVTLDRPNHTISTTSIKGPFKHLENNWYFKAIDDHSCDVHFTIDYAFNSWPMEKLMGSMFEQAFKKYAESFEARAEAIK